MSGVLCEGVDGGELEDMSEGNFREPFLLYLSLIQGQGRHQRGVIPILLAMKK